jgi:spore maturation protein CgeB
MASTSTPESVVGVGGGESSQVPQVPEVLGVGSETMHLLIVAATNIRTSDAPFLLAEAIERQRHRVSLIALDDELGPAADLGYRVGGFDDPVYRAVFQRRIRRKVRRLAPDGVLLYGSNWALEPETIQFLRRKLGMTVSLWEINHMIFNNSQAQCLPLFDHIFCLDSYYVPFVRSQDCGCVEHLCAAADPDEHRPLSLSRDERDEYSADVSFVGTYHPERAEAIAAFDGVTDRVRIYGHRWDQAPQQLARWVQVEPVYGRKKTVIYGASRLSLHVRGPHMFDGENFRVFEVAACGGVVLARYSPDLERCFDLRNEVVLFNEPTDLRTTLTHYLSHPDELLQVAEAGRRRVLAEHTYGHRAATIIEHLRQCTHRGNTYPPPAENRW